MCMIKCESDVWSRLEWDEVASHRVESSGMKWIGHSRRKCYVAQKCSEWNGVDFLCRHIHVLVLEDIVTMSSLIITDKNRIKITE